MSVEANVVTREKANALLVPADAVQGCAVFVIDGNRVRRRQVEIGIRGARSVEVLSGPRRGRAGRLAGTAGYRRRRQGPDRRSKSCRPMNLVVYIALTHI